MKQTKSASPPKIITRAVMQLNRLGKNAQRLIPPISVKVFFQLADKADPAWAIAMLQSSISLSSPTAVKLTGANETPHRRRGLAVHYMRASTMYIPMEDEEARMLTECEMPPGKFRFMRIRGREFAGRM